MRREQQEQHTHQRHVAPKAVSPEPAARSAQCCASRAGFSGSPAQAMGSDHDFEKRNSCSDPTARPPSAAAANRQPQKNISEIGLQRLCSKRNQLSISLNFAGSELQIMMLPHE